MDPSEAQAPLEGNSLPEPLPFEAPERHPRLLERIQATFQLGILCPTAFVERLALRRSLLSAWSFSVLVALPFHALAFLLGRATFRLLGHLLGASTQPHLGRDALLQLPLLAFGAFALAALFHLCLWMAGGTRRGLGFVQSFRLVAYSLGFLAPVAWIPLVNIAAVPLWLGYLAYTFARLHRTETWRGALAVVGPMVLFWCMELALLPFGALASTKVP